MYATIRNADLLGPLIGVQVVDVTQQDEEEWLLYGISYFCLHFANGMTLKIVVDDNTLIEIG